MQKIIVLIVCLILLCGFISCTSKNSGSNGDNQAKIENDSEQRVISKYGLKEEFFCRQGNLLYYINQLDNNSIYCRSLDKGDARRVTGDSVHGLCIMDGWIYYINSSDGGRIYRIKTDGSDKTKLSEDPASGFAAFKGFVYYIKGDGEGKIYRITIDGTDRIKIADDTTSQIFVANGQVYYINISNKKMLTSVDLDGKNKLGVSNDPVSRFAVDGSRIYYVNDDLGKVMYLGNGNLNGKEVKECSGELIAAVDGKIYYKIAEYLMIQDVISGEVKTLEGFPRTHNITVIGDMVYCFSNGYDEEQYRISLNGGEEERYYSKRILKSIKIGDSAVYSVKDGNEIYKMNEDGTAEARITQWDPRVVIESVRLDGDWLYYMTRLEGDTPSKLYRMKFDSSENLEINNDGISRYFEVEDNVFYYSNGKDGFRLWRSSWDGKNKIKLTNDPTDRIRLQNDWVYYVINDNDMKICKIKTDGSLKKEIVPTCTNSYVLSEEWIYYLDKNWRLCKVRDDGTGMTILDDKAVTDIREVSKGWVYYSNYGESGGPYCWYDTLYRVRTDGTDASILTEGIIRNYNFIGEWIYYWKAKGKLELVEYDTAANSVNILDMIKDE